MTMSWGWWLLICLGIVVLGAALLGLLALRVWRQAKALKPELARFAELADQLEQARREADAKRDSVTHVDA